MWVFNTKLNRDVNEVLSNVETEKDLLILSLMPASQTYKRKSWNLYEGWKDVQCLIKKK